MIQTLRKPSWIKAKIPAGSNYIRLRNLTRNLNLHTVCEEAQCPNVGECWGAGTLTFMILGETIRKVREYNPEITIEVLIPDFKGDIKALKEVLDAKPGVLNHNIETVPRLYYLPVETESGLKRSVRPQAKYEWSLRVLEKSKKLGHHGLLSKSGIM